MHDAIYKFLQGKLPVSIKQIDIGLDFSLPKTSTWDEGGVYGFCAELDEDQLSNIIEEATKRGTISKYVKEDGKIGKLFDKSRFKPLEEGGNLFPLYWGKDQGFRSRLKSHISSELTSTGSLYLGVYQSLQNIKIGYSAILVSNRWDFEKFLQRNYPPLLQTQTAGEND